MRFYANSVVVEQTNQTFWQACKFTIVMVISRMIFIFFPVFAVGWPAKPGANTTNEPRRINTYCPVGITYFSRFTCEQRVIKCGVIHNFPLFIQKIVKEKRYNKANSDDAALYELADGVVW